ncbi:hypothetical protein DH2020_011309 [Rehmannia glutinosa]|uniref:X8 domain-containing protein n=1 Tax=Rehmannia glutinosa TaxID=99300 RepID=A0ABR0XD53_REHGL
MNPGINSIKISILAIFTLLASSSCRLCCAHLHDNLTISVAAEIDGKLLNNFPSSINADFQPTENNPPLCVYPPPPSASSPAPPPPHTKLEHRVWCVAKPTLPDSLMQQALDYACASGADCEPIRLNGLCYQPNTVLAHASYAFNSYWQRTKRAGGTCDFGGSAMLVTVDPSQYFI